MPNYVNSIAVDDCIEALAVFLTPFVGSAQIIRAQENRVAPPPSPFVELTELLTVDLETPTVTDADDPDTPSVIIKSPKQIDIQIDFYGPQSGDQCGAVQGVYRSEYCPAQFPDNIKPLYCSNGIQAPLITGEKQYESRWTLTASLQYNPSVSIPAQFAEALSVKTFEDLP